MRGEQDDPGAGNVWVALSTGSGFAPSTVWHDLFCVQDELCRVADVDGDERDDIVAMIQDPAASAPVWVATALASGSGFGMSGIWYDEFCVFDEAVCMLGNFDGDGKADAIMFLRDSAPATMGFDQRQGRVDVMLSTGTQFTGYASQHDSFCYGEEVCGVGDFDGDGRDDMVAFVRSTKTGDGEGDVWVALSTIAGDSGRVGE